jgi:serine/threonine protein kinase
MVPNLADFGSPRWWVTGVGAIFNVRWRRTGTILYMAPEQFGGVMLDPRADLLRSRLHFSQTSPARRFSRVGSS